MVRYRLPGLALALLLLSCGGPPGPPLENERPPIPPVGLLVEEVVSGPVLGDPLNYPVGLAVGFDGTVFVMDSGNDRLLKFDPSLIPVSEVGGYGTSAGQFSQATFVTVNSGLSLAVSDEGNRRIVSYDSRLNYVDELVFEDDDDPLKFGTPSGLAVTDYGEMWVADRERNRIAVFDNVGNFNRFVGNYGYSGGQLINPEKIVADFRDNFIVCDAGNARLVMYDQYGNFIRDLKAQNLGYPMAVTFSKDMAWVIDGNEGRLVALDMKGKEIFQVGPRLIGDRVPLKEPSDIAFLADGRLLISDSGNTRLLVCRIIFNTDE